MDLTLFFLAGLSSLFLLASITARRVVFQVLTTTAFILVLTALGVVITR